MVFGTTVISAWLASYSVSARFERFVIEKNEDLDEFVRTSTSNLDSGLIVEVYFSDDQGSGARFLQSVNQALVIVVLIAGLISLMLLISLANPGLKMIEVLTQAAMRMASGDLSQRVPLRSNDEIGHLARSFNEMANNLERAEKLRRNMVSDAAHELRTPLTNLQGYMEGLRDGVIVPSPQLFDALHAETKLLTRLVNDLQELTLAEAGYLRLNYQAVSLHEVVSRAVDGLLGGLSEPYAQVLSYVNVSLPKVWGDPDRLTQILRNLIDNALVHTPSTGTITISACPEGAFVRVVVKDTGIGIPAEHLSNIFERFYRVDPSRARTTGGTGIGLTIVKQLVESHGGQITVISEYGHGSTFSFTIPCVQMPS